MVYVVLRELRELCDTSARVSGVESARLRSAGKPNTNGTKKNNTLHSLRPENLAPPSCVGDSRIPTYYSFDMGFLIVVRVSGVLLSAVDFIYRVHIRATFFCAYRACSNYVCSTLRIT